MTDDMGFDLKLPAVGELTFPQWQDWLARYNAVLGDRERRIEKLETALREMINWDNVLDLEDYPPWDDAMELARKALEVKENE